MKNTAAKLFLVLLLVACGFSHGARAEEPLQFAFLDCNAKANSFSVTLINVSNESEEKINAVINGETVLHEEGMQRMPNSSCILDDKHHVKVSSNSGIGYGYGMGGGDPDVFFTLTVDNKAVFYHYPFYKGYGSDDGQVVSNLKYINETLQACGSEFNGCADVTNRLSGNALTDDEKAEQAKDTYARTINENLSPFCKGVRHNLEVVAFGGDAESSDFPIDFFKFDSSIDIAGNDVSKSALDINNDGKQDLVYRVGGTSDDCIGCGEHFFDGSFLILSNETAAEKDGVKAFLTKDEFDAEDVIPEPVSHIPGLQSLMISGGHAGSSPRYVYNLPFKQGDKTYIYSFESNYTNVPSGSVNLLTPDNKLETICLYAGRPPN